MVENWKLKSVWTHELDYDGFYLGLREYKYEDIPDPIGEMPEDPEKDWTLGERYDKPNGWQFDRQEYKAKLHNWK